MWIAFDFDRTIVGLGQWVEGRRFTYDKRGNRTDHLEELLDPHGPLPLDHRRRRQSAYMVGGEGFTGLPDYTKEQWERDKQRFAAASQ